MESPKDPYNPSGEALDELRAALLAWRGLRNVRDSDREDLVQDAISIALENLQERAAEFDHASFARYTYGILRFRTALYFRNRLAANRLAGTTASRAERRSIDTLADAERKELVMAAVSQLSELDRDILFLRLTDKMQYSQIAEHLDMRVDTIRQRFFRAMSSIRQAYFDRA
jgi:RNA polymerase sigma factor (sigma-70 family)